MNTTRYNVSRAGEFRNTPVSVISRTYRQHDPQVIQRIIGEDGQIQDLEFICRLYTDVRDDGSATKLFRSDSLAESATNLIGLPIYIEHSYPDNTKFPRGAQRDKRLYTTPTEHSQPIVSVYANIVPGEVFVRGRLDPSGMSPEEVAELRRHLVTELTDVSISYGINSDPRVLVEGNIAHALHGDVLPHVGGYARLMELSLTRRGDVAGCNVIMVKASSDEPVVSEIVDAKFAVQTRSATAVSVEKHAGEMETSGQPTSAVATTTTSASQSAGQTPAMSSNTPQQHQQQLQGDKPQQPSATSGGGMMQPTSSTTIQGAQNTGASSASQFAQQQPSAATAQSSPNSSQFGAAMQQMRRCRQQSIRTGWFRDECCVVAAATAANIFDCTDTTCPDHGVAGGVDVGVESIARTEPAAIPAATAVGARTVFICGIWWRRRRSIKCDTASGATVVIVDWGNRTAGSCQGA
jgi:hypothetical protein